MHEINKSNNTVDLESIVLFWNYKYLWLLWMWIYILQPLAIYIKQM